MYKVIFNRKLWSVVCAANCVREAAVESQKLISDKSTLPTPGIIYIWRPLLKPPFSV